MNYLLNFVFIQNIDYSNKQNDPQARINKVNLPAYASVETKSCKSVTETKLDFNAY